MNKKILADKPEVLSDSATKILIRLARIAGLLKLDNMIIEQSIEHRDRNVLLEHILKSNEMERFEEVKAMGGRALRIIYKQEVPVEEYEFSSIYMAKGGVYVENVPIDEQKLLYVLGGNAEYSDISTKKDLSEGDIMVLPGGTTYNIGNKSVRKPFHFFVITYEYNMIQGAQNLLTNIQLTWLHNFSELLKSS